MLCVFLTPDVVVVFPNPTSFGGLRWLLYLTSGAAALTNHTQDVAPLRQGDIATVAQTRTQYAARDVQRRRFTPAALDLLSGMFSKKKSKKQGKTRRRRRLRRR